MKLIYLCPITPKGSCLWEGRSADIFPHFEDSHSDLIMDSNIIKVNTARENESNHIMRQQNDIFLVQINVLSHKVSVKLRYLGSPRQASLIRYCLIVTCGKFAFANARDSRDPVYINNDYSIEVDLQAIKLLSGQNCTHVNCHINLEKLSPEEKLSKDADALFEAAINELNEEVFFENELQNMEDRIVSENNGNLLLNERKQNEIMAEHKDAQDTDSVDLNKTDLVEADHSKDGTEEKEEVLDDPSDPLSINETLPTDELEIKERLIETDNSDFTNEFFFDSYSYNAMPEGDKLDMLRCTNCLQIMIPPIYICPDGHSVCYSCRDHACVACSQSITELRNIDLEDVTKTLRYPCRFFGCTEKYMYNEIRRHEIYCDYCIYRCQLCEFEGKHSDIKYHIKMIHPSTKIFETLEGIPFPKDSNMAIINSNGVFYCTSSVHDMQIEWSVVFCGPKERNFSCEVKIKGKKPQQQKHYFLKREEGNNFKLAVSLDKLKSASIKVKNATLHISSY